MGNPTLFKPIRIHKLALPNRIVIAPMCQYSAENGCMNEWHLIHLGQLAIPVERLPGAALVASTFRTEMQVQSSNPSPDDLM
jgi:2,4-dienoyl-CoA reductase-like NADH-dependent reductase (Old Yellow Enzyme family)